MATNFPDLPRDARHAASQGFNFREGSLTVEDDFVDGSQMLRRGSMAVQDDLGNTIEFSFAARFEFGTPVAVER